MSYTGIGKSIILLILVMVTHVESLHVIMLEGLQVSELGYSFRLLWGLITPLVTYSLLFIARVVLNNYIHLSITKVPQSFKY